MWLGIRMRRRHRSLLGTLLLQSPLLKDALPKDCFPHHSIKQMCHSGNFICISTSQSGAPMPAEKPAAVLKHPRAHLSPCEDELDVVLSGPGEEGLCIPQ